MKILLVSLYMVEYAVELANALVNDHQVHIILSDNRVKQTFGNKIDSRIHRSVRKTIVPYRNNAKIFNVKCILKMISAYISFSPDIIHIQEASNPLSLFLYLIRWKPIVTTVHDVEIHPGAQKRNLSRKRKWALKFLREKIYKTIIVHGKLLKLKYLADYRKTKEDVYVVPHGALFTFSEIMQSDISEEKSTVLFFGRIDKYKGLSYLIDAEPLVSKILPDFKLVIAGSGNDLDNNIDAIRNNIHYEIDDRYIPFDEVSRYFKRAAAVVLPYIEASQSGVAAIAFAFGKPVIACNVGSLCEIVIHGYNGLLVPPKDPAKLSEAIISVLKYPEYKKKLSRGAIITANTTLNWDCIAKATTEIYSKIDHF